MRSRAGGGKGARLEFLVSSLPRPAALHRVGRSRARMHAGASVEFPAHPSALILEAKRWRARQDESGHWIEVVSVT